MFNQRMVTLPPEFQDYGFTVSGGRDNIFSVTVWERYAGTTIGEFWATDYREILTRSLLNVAMCDIALSEGIA